MIEGTCSMYRDKHITAPSTLPSSGGIFFKIGAIPNMLKGRNFFSIIVILLMIKKSSCRSAGRDWPVMFIFPMGGRDVAVVIVDIVSIVDWLNPWRRLEGGPVSA
jgi:hypothetical protein